MSCDACGPSPTNHRVDWFVNYTTDVLDIVDRFGYRVGRSGGARARAMAVAVRRALLWMGERLRVLHWESTDASALPSRIRLVVERVQIRGWRVERLRCLGQRMHIFRASREAAAHRYWEVLPRGNTRIRESIIDDKALVKHCLAQAGIPVPHWRVVRTVRDARRAAQAIRYPLVVKPRSGSLSRHTTVGVCDEGALVTAFRSAQMLDWKVLLEEQLPGAVYRATIVAGRCAAVCRRLPPSVTGDGKRTIAELLVERNADARRGARGDVRSTHHQFHGDETTIEILRTQGKMWSSVPAAGERVDLHEKVTLGYGCDIEDVTDVVHAETRELFVRIAETLGADLVGIDFIIPEIRQSWRAQRCGVIECNTLPSIDMHHAPTHGTPRDVAGALVDILLRDQGHERRRG
ncbi:hypothetical protein HYV74_02965 [Candidatus Uhrbacteria bacterium]|nr:hypothetical protein [Candidatus Uhrbacteria bacterium]